LVTTRRSRARILPVLDTLLESNEQLAHWVQDSGHTTSGPSRELYLQWSEQDPASKITELQAVLIT